MGQLVHLDREMEIMFKKIEKLRNKRIRGMVVAVVHEGDELEEFYFCGNPTAIYQSLALAQAHILQNFSLMDEGCECSENKLDGEEEED